MSGTIAERENCADALGAPVIDVFSLPEGKETLYSPDGVRPTEGGYTELAEYIYENAKIFLGK